MTERDRDHLPVVHLYEEVRVSTTLAAWADIFHLDLESIADEVLRDHVVHSVTSSLTLEMQQMLLAARELANSYGHRQVSCEHLLLAMLQDQHTIVSQVVRGLGQNANMRRQIETLVASPSYHLSGQKAGPGKEDRTTDGPT